MSLLLLVIGPILTVLIGSWIQTYLFQSSRKELDSYKEFNKTTYPKRLLTFFFVATLVVSILFIALGIVIYVTSVFDQSTQWIAYFASGIFIIAIPLVGFINTITSYELIEEDKIIVKRWFKSRRSI